MAKTFYMNLFTTEPHADVNTILEAIPPHIDQATNEILCKPYSNEEIKGSALSDGTNKSPWSRLLSCLILSKALDHATG